jgi:phosphoglycerate dehydrogenase-like enzyme
VNILITSSIDPAALERLRRDHDVVHAPGADENRLCTLVRDRQAIVFRSGVTISARVMQNAPGLRLLVRAGSGVDNIDLGHVQRNDIELIRIPEPGARAVAELTLGLMIVLARDILRADTLWRGGRWAKNELTGFLLRGKTLGVVGAGSIGTTVGSLAVACGMRVLGCVEWPHAGRAASLQKQGITLATFDEVIRAADFLTIHVPLQPSTRNLVDAEVLARMKPGAFLLNLARGGVVVEEALRDALLSGHLRGAALDVHQREGDALVSPLADLPNVVLTPHIGATTVDTQREIGERIVQALGAIQSTSNGARPMPRVAGAGRRPKHEPVSPMTREHSWTE